MRINEQIDIILSDFNFGLVAKVMKTIEWNYEGHKSSPTKSELKVMAEFCLREAVTNNSNYFSVGGFEAEVIEGCLELKFVLDRVNPLSHIIGVNSKSKKHELKKP